MLQQPAAYNGRDDLRGHGEGVIVAGVLAHVAALGDLHHHGVGIDVDHGPGRSHQGEDPIQRRAELRKQRCRAKAGRQQQNARLNDALAAKARGEKAHGQVADHRAHGGYHQALGSRLDVIAPLDAYIFGKGGGDGIVAHEPQANRAQNQDQATAQRRVQ